MSLARASRHEHATHPSDSIPVDPFGPPKTGLKAYQRFDDIVEEPEEEEQVDKESVGGLEIDLGRESPLESTDRKKFIQEVIASDDDDDVVIIEEEEVDVKVTSKALFFFL